MTAVERARPSCEYQEARVSEAIFGASYHSQSLGNVAKL